MKIKIQRNSLRSFLIRLSLCAGSCLIPAAWPALQAQVTGTWNYTAGNDNWSNTARWVDGIVPNGIGDTANLTSAITSSRTITNNVGTITLGTLNIGTSANSTAGFTLSGGTLRLETLAGPALIQKTGNGGSDTISSAIQIVAPLEVNLSNQRNSTGISFTGVITGGTPGATTMTLRSTVAEDFVNWFRPTAANTFEGRMVVESGHLRLENGGAAGARGVGNETVVLAGGRVDLRNSLIAAAADDAEIFQIAGAGPNGLGALINTTGTGQIAHLTLTADATVGGQSLTLLARRRNTANDADIAPILDLGGHSLTKLGVSDFRLINADLQNAAGAVWNVHEGILKFENRGALDGGALIGGSTYGNQIDGMTFNVQHVNGAYDGMNPLNGSRTSDPFNPNRAASDTLGNTAIAARLAFRTDWSTGNTHAANTHVVENYDNLTVNLNNGSFQREGNGETGRTFDHIFGPGTTVNLVGGTLGQNVFSLSGGSGNYNAALLAYDHPGVTEIQGSVANTGGSLAGEGFTVRGGRELRLTGANAGFQGDVLIKTNTARWMAPNYSNASGAHESQYFSLSLAGAAGTLHQADSLTVTRWGSLGLLNSADGGANNRGSFASANHNDRLNDAGALSLRNGIVYLETHATEANTENLGHVGADLGTNYVYVDTRAGGRFGGALASLTRRESGVLKIGSMNGAHTWSAEAGADVRVAVNDASNLTLTGADSPGQPGQRVVQGIFGTVVPSTFAARTGSAVSRSDYTNQMSYAYGGSGMRLMTLENVGGTDYLRPLTDAEYHISGTPLAEANWRVDRYISPDGGPFGYADRRNFPGRNVTGDTVVNSLTLGWDEALSGQAVPTGERDYVVLDPTATLTVRSGIINFASFAEAATANLSAGIRGGRLDMDGQAAIINSCITWHDTDTTSGTWSSFIVGNSAFLRSPLTNVTDLVKTGRNSLYLETWNDLTGNVYVSEQGGLYARHPGALGTGAAGREVVIAGAGNFYLEYGTSIDGINLRVSNSTDTSRTILAGIGAYHSSWGGDIQVDGADAAGSHEFQNHVITARNNGTLSLYGNLYTVNNGNLTDSDTWGDPQVLSTAVGESATLNLFGQFRDTATGPLAAVGATGDNATRLDRNHSLVFQMRGHNEINVNAHQQWNATGSVFATQGYFRILYDPFAEGLDGNGFQTDAARAAITQDNQWNQMTLGGYQNFLGIGNSAVNAYHGHILLTREQQVLNFADRLVVTNNNRNHTLTLGGEHETGSAYIGSSDNSSAYRIFFQNSNSERDLRFLQAAGGTLVVNARLEDGNTTANSFNSSVSLVGPGTVVFNRNAAGNSTVDRWNFLAGTAIWDGMTGNNQFARTWGTGSEIGSVSGWGGGTLVLASPVGTTMRTQTLNGGVHLLGGASAIKVNQATTMTVGAAARPFHRSAAATMAFYENGNGVVNFSGSGLIDTAGTFLAPWAVYGNDADGIMHWAARQGTTGVQAFAGYANDAFGAGQHANLTQDATLTEPAVADTLRFDGAAVLDLGTDHRLTLSQGGLLVPASSLADVSLSGGALTSAWSAGGHDLLVHNHGQGSLLLGSVLEDDGANRVNLVLAGPGTTVLAADNTFTGDIHLNQGVLQVSADAQLGVVNGSIARLVLSGPGSSYASGASGVAVTFTGGGSGSGASATFNTVSSTTASARGVNNITLTEGGSGYTSGVRVLLEDGTGSNAGAWAVLDSGNLHFNGGVLHATESFALNSGRTIFLGGNGGTLRVDPGRTLTIDGFISGAYSHVSPGNGYNSANGLGNAWDAASVRNPDIGDLTVDGGGTVVFRYSPLGDGSTPSNLAHAYGGITRINEGVLRLEGIGTTGATGALGTHQSFGDGTIIGASGTLSMFFSASDPSIQEWFTLRGTGYQGGGTFAATVPGSARTYNLAGQIHVEQDASFNIRNAHNFYVNNGGGNMYGKGSITYTGNGTLRLYGNNPEWKGALRLGSGSTYISGAGRLQGMSALDLQRNAFLLISAGATSVDEFRDRLPDTLPIAGDGWVRLRLDATGGVYSGLEKAGVLTAGSGVTGIEYNLGADIAGSAPRLAGDWAGWHFSEIRRQPGAVVAVRNLDAGTQFGGAGFGGSSQETTDRALLLVDTAPVTVGGDGSAFNHAIAPGFFGGTRELWFNTAGTGNLFTEETASRQLMTLENVAHPVTGAPVSLLRPLRADEFRTLGSDAPVNQATPDAVVLDPGDIAGQNLAFTGRTGDAMGGEGFTGRRNSTLTLGSSATVNSVSFQTDAFIDGAASGRGNTTLLLLNDNATLTVGSGVLNFANLGVQERGGLAHNTSVNADLRSFIQGGRLDFDGREAILHANSRWVHYNTADALGAYRETDVDSTQVFINSSLTNTGGNGLTKSGGNSVYLQAANTYSGDTHVNHGLLYARHNQALGASTRVNITGSGGLAVGLGVEISGVDVHIGALSTNASAFFGEQSSIFNGDVIVDNVDLAGATAYTRNFTPRIYNNSTSIFNLNGDIHGGATPLATGIRATESRLFSTYTGAQGIFNVRGRIMDTPDGPLDSLVTEANQNQVLRMEILDTTSENHIQLWQPYESAGRIRLLRGVLRYMGGGNFYSDAASAALNPDNPMSGFQMGGRGVVNSAGTGGANLALVLANAGSVFNLASWEIGVESTDRDNTSGNDNFNRGNTTGNRTLAGENRSGTVTFGTGAGGITFVNDERFGGYDAPLQLYAAEGGRVDLRAALLDGGDGVNSSITKSGRGEVRLLGSSRGDSTVEAVHVLGGLLLLDGYDAQSGRRVGEAAGLVLGGGGLVLNAGGTAATEVFGDVRVNPGGSTLAATGAGSLTLNGSFTRQTGGQAHFQSIAGGSLRAAGLASGSRIGAWATYGASLNSTPLASDWAATDAGGLIVAFSGYSTDSFGAGNHTDVVAAGLTGGSTASLRFNDAAGSVTGGSLVLSDGGVLITSNYTGGTPLGAGVALSAAAGDLIVHNFASGEVVLAGDLGGGDVVFNGTGRTRLGGANAYSGTTFVTGAATVVIDGLARLGATSGLQLNGGTVEITGAGLTETLSLPLTLGGNDGVLRVTEADSRLILRGAAANQIASEANPVASVTSNPFNGGLKLTGAGTVQFGDRSAANNAQDLLGVNNAYTGFTELGDGVAALTVEIQGQGNDNAQFAPFGTHVGWTDATLVRDQTRIEFAVRRGDSGRDNQVRFREWFQWGESAADVVKVDVSTGREIALEGIQHIVGTLEVTTQNRGYADGGSPTSQGTLYFGLNEGGVSGGGRIHVNPQPNPVGNTYGTLQIRDSIPDFTGDFEVSNGYLAFYGLGYTQGTGTTPVLLGSEGASNSHRADIRLLPENGTNGSSTITTAFDAPPTDLTFYRDIRLADDSNQDLRLFAGYAPANGFFRWQGDIDTGDSPADTFRFYYEDTENLDPRLTGFQQQVVLEVSGNLSGNRRLLFDVTEGGDINQTLTVDLGGRASADQHRAIFTTLLLKGDNSAFQGDVRVSAETSTTTMDRDDLPMLRLGSDLALSAQNNVILQTLSAFQVGGLNATIGNLSTFGGNSTTGLYSFTNQDWAPDRNSLYDLDFIVGSNSGSTGKNVAAVGASTEIVENAAATPGVLTLTQTVNGSWDAYFRDGRQDALLNGSTEAAGSLSLVKAGAGRAVMTIFNDYTGTTTVSEGALQVGNGGTGQWALLAQGTTVARTAVNTDVGGSRAVGSTGWGPTSVLGGATLSGSGHVRGQLNVAGSLAPGDVLGGGAAGSDLGTLFVGGSGSVAGASLTISNGTLTLQVKAPTTSEAQLGLGGSYNLNDVASYESFVAMLPAMYDGTATNPLGFGQTGTHIQAGAQHDHLEIGGGIVWNGGQIEVAAFDGFAPAAGDVYNLMDWYGVASWNTFDGGDRYRVGGEAGTDLTLPDLSAFDAALRWDTGLFASHGILVVAVVPEPGRALLVVLGLAALLMRRRR